MNTVRTNKTNLFAVVYRSGGTERCTWRRMLGDVSLTSALNSANELEKMGYKALVFDVSVLETIGLPVGWTYSDVDYDEDLIEVSSHQTYWVKYGNREVKG